MRLAARQRLCRDHGRCRAAPHRRREDRQACASGRNSRRDQINGGREPVGRDNGKPLLDKPRDARRTAATREVGKQAPQPAELQRKEQRERGKGASTSGERTAFGAPQTEGGEMPMIADREQARRETTASTHDQARYLGAHARAGGESASTGDPSAYAVRPATSIRP